MKVVGIMSGTSLDGIDIALCNFFTENGKWSFEIDKAETFVYSDEWRTRLSSAQDLAAEEFVFLHNDYGSYIGKCIRTFLGDKLKADLIASHGHTVFHQPDRKMTFQIGNAPYIAAECNLAVISDFRTTDVALGGQGAPLVPVGDQILFGEYEFCLNLGGFANVSNDFNGSRIACDLCPVNIVSNELSGRLGLEYDKDGILGLNGNLIKELTDELNELPFYKIKGPKSLGREWVETVFMPVIDKYKTPVPDLLRSFYEHVSDQISNYISADKPGIALITGGGAFNKFLIELISNKIKLKLVIPEEKIVKYKEALIFAFLGMLRFENQINCISSVTGARKNSSGGGVYLA